MASTPKKLKGHIKAFCASISTAKPTFVAVKPVHSADHLECYHNAKAVAAQQGGEVVFGWAVYEWPGVYVEAIHHAVVKTNGLCQDVTPGDDDWILFVPDSSVPYDYETNAQFDNKRLALVDDPLVHQWFDACKENFGFHQQFPRGMVVLEGEHARVYATLQRRRVELERLVSQKYGHA